MGRKQKTIHYLYKTICKVTGKYYIGMHSTSDLEDGYMGSGRRLRHSIRKYGEENHVKKILEFFDCREALVEAEKRAITSDMLVDVNCMNLMSGGTGGFISVEHQLKLSLAGNKAKSIKMKNDPNFFDKMVRISSDRFKELHKINALKNSTRFLGKKHSDETKKQIGNANSIKQAGNTNSQFGTMWITNSIENRKVKKEDLIPDGWYKGRKFAE